MVVVGQPREPPSQFWMPEECLQMAAAAKEDQELPDKGQDTLPREPVLGTLRQEECSVGDVSNQADAWAPPNMQVSSLKYLRFHYGGALASELRRIHRSKMFRKDLQSVGAGRPWRASNPHFEKG